MMGLGFAQDRRKVAAAEAESLLDGSGDRDFGFVAGNAEFVAVNPEAPGAVIDFKRCHSHHVERIDHATRDRDFVIVKARGITIDGFDASVCRAGSKKRCRGDQTRDGYESGNFGQGVLRVIGLLKHSAQMKVAGFAVRVILS